jgi:phage repressor protein C with HTH and peptisase S24 domain
MKKGTGDMIRERREALQISQADLARMVGIKQPSLHNIEIGKTKHSRYLPEIAEALGLDPHSLRSSRLNAIGNPINMQSKFQKQNAQDFPVYYMMPAPKPGGAEGGFILSAEAVDYLERPAVLASVNDAFGICVYSDAMSPKYEAGDIVLVHPYKPPVVGHTKVVVRPSDVNDSRVHIGLLADETASHWVLYQYKRKETIKLPKAEWGRCDSVIGSWDRS